jgi:hypothetical protein
MFQIKFVEKIKTNLCSKTHFHAVYEIMWKNMIQPERPQTKIWHVRISRWITKDKSTHSDYVIFIAFPPQYWLHKNASVLRCTYIACHSLLSIVGRFHGDEISLATLERTTVQARGTLHCETYDSYQLSATSFQFRAPECKTSRIPHDQDFPLFPLP